MQVFAKANDKTKDYKFEIIPCLYGSDLEQQGPDSILKASQGLEFYDDELMVDSTESGIYTHEAIKIEAQTSEIKKPFIDLYNKCSETYTKNKFPLVLGANAALSLASIKAAYDALNVQGKNLTLLHFDSNADLHKEYNSNLYDQECLIYSVYKNCPKIKVISIGVRNISIQESEWLRALEKQVSEHVLDDMPIAIFYARDEFYKTYAFRSALKEFREEVNPKDDDLSKSSPGAIMKFWGSKDVIALMKKSHNENFYISFDLRAFDSSLMPSVDRADPGGLDWYTPTNLIREASKYFNLVGADIVGLKPIEGLQAPNILAAKLAYKILANVIINQNNISPEVQD